MSTQDKLAKALRHRIHNLRLQADISASNGDNAGSITRRIVAEALERDLQAHAAETGQERAVGDPHHDGACSWRWDGVQLWHRFGTNKWVKTSRIHPTPARIAALHSIMCKTTGMNNDKLAEALRNARSFVSLFHDDPAQVCVAEIDAALQAHAAEAAQRAQAFPTDDEIRRFLVESEALLIADEEELLPLIREAIAVFSHAAQEHPNG